MLATVATVGLTKSDMFSDKAISEFANKQRQQDNYAYTSKVVMLGTGITEGECLYLKREHPQWREAVELLIQKLQDIQQENDADTLVLRDFHTHDQELFEVFYGNSFIRKRGPDSYRFENVQRYRSEQYFADLKWKKRKHWRESIGAHEQKFNFQVAATLDKQELHQAYTLYTNVQKSSLEINTYALPFKLFQYCNCNDDWEFLKIYSKDTFELAAMGLCYRTSMAYIPLIVGMDYRYQDAGIYRVALDQALHRSYSLGYDLGGLGIGAGFEMYRIGAV